MKGSNNNIQLHRRAIFHQKNSLAIRIHESKENQKRKRKQKLRIPAKTRVKFTLLQQINSTFYQFSP